ALQHVLLRVETRPEDHVLPAFAPCDAHREGHRRDADGAPRGRFGGPARATRLDTGAARRRDPERGERRRGRRLFAREPRDLRGVPMSAALSPQAHDLVSSARPARLLDPGMCLTLRPMAYPAFFEMYRAALKNTWSV